ncbi:unnamed protein product [Protopolystoma xenopodis]|uniref:Uncharacterized protein n=1 Tax=Protopolystoma xenopodis TaxID=117903 RepID=A0A448WRI9_9PLAT|nr:unnamed protein product [Protopolystoma xenopodis]
MGRLIDSCVNYTYLLPNKTYATGLSNGPQSFLISQNIVFPPTVDSTPQTAIAADEYLIPAKRQLLSPAVASSALVSFLPPPLETSVDSKQNGPSKRPYPYLSHPQPSWELPFEWCGRLPDCQCECHLSTPLLPRLGCHYGHSSIQRKNQLHFELAPEPYLFQKQQLATSTSLPPSTYPTLFSVSNSALPPQSLQYSPSQPPPSRSSAKI